MTISNRFNCVAHSHLLTRGRVGVKVAPGAPESPGLPSRGNRFTPKRDMACMPKILTASRMSRFVLKPRGKEVDNDRWIVAS